MRVGAQVRPYWFKAVLLMSSITVASLLSLISPLILRDLSDNTLTNKDVVRLNRLALALLAITVLTGLIRVAQGYLTSAVGEGVLRSTATSPSTMSHWKSAHGEYPWYGLCRV